MSACIRQLTHPALVGSALLVLAACQDANAPDKQSDLRVSGTTPAELAFFPPPPKIPTPHPWVGKTIRISDLGGNRCLEPQQVAAEAKINTAFCYQGSGLDLAQRFIVVRAGSAFNGDITAVAFELALDPSLCLDVRGGTATGGETLQLATCNMSTRQIFHLPQPPATGPTRGPILTKVSGYTMALDVGSSTIGVIVTQRFFNSTSMILTYREWTGSAYWGL